MNMKTAKDLKPGQEGKILDFSDPFMAGQLMTLGILPETRLLLVRKSPFGSTFYFRSGNYNLALRKSEAANIIIS